LIDADLRRAVGLVTEEQYEVFFDRYIENVTHWIKGEKIYNPVTGNSAPPDEEFMVEVEQKLGATGEDEEFRTNIMGTIAAWSLDNPSETLHYPTIFASHLEALRQAFYDDRLAQVRTIVHDIVAVFSGEEDQLDVAQRSQVTTTVDALIRDHGYTEDSAREAVTHLFKERYQ
jgi:predicted Ser/Thr protein kinase